MVDPPAQNQNGSRELNCLIDGKSDVFQVIVAIHKKVGNLWEEIQGKRERTTFKDVDHTALEPCKVSSIDEWLCEVALAYSRSLTGRH